MWAVRRVFVFVGLLVSVAGFAAFVTGIGGAWWAKAETNRRTDSLATKALNAIDAADRAVAFVSKVVDQGKEDVKNARARAPESPQKPVNPFLQLTARRASEDLAGSVERAGAAVVTASEAAVVAEAAVEVLGDDAQLPELKQWLGVKPEQLAQTRTDLNRASNELKQVRSILGVSVGDGELSREQLVTVESALNRARELTDQMARVVVTARLQVVETKRTVDLWALRVAIGVTVVGAVGAAGQFFMARYFWRVLRGKPA
jgi:hypothetical protein